MTPERFKEITRQYPGLKIAVAGDFCLDRYFEIDPARAEISIETGLEVHNVTRVRTQPGAAGTILNNLAALDIGEIVAVGFCGHDAEGQLLKQTLRARPNVNLKHFLSTAERTTFTYSKPLVIEPGKAPRELNRLDQKNWTETPPSVSSRLVQSLHALAGQVDAIAVMDQVERSQTGTMTTTVLEGLRSLATARPELPILADSRQGLAHYPPLIFKMNANELRLTIQAKDALSLNAIWEETEKLAARLKRPAFVTLAENGIVGAAPGQKAQHTPCHPTRGEIDIVGAGDAVAANLISALAARAAINEAMELAMAAAAIVVHQLGATGTASRSQILALLQTGAVP